MARLHIECWHCENVFGFTADVSRGGIIRTFCGICDSENVVDLDPYRSPEETILRMTNEPGHDEESEAKPIRYRFPEKLIGARPDEDGSPDD